MLTDTLGDGAGGNLTVRSSETIEIIGTSTIPFVSGLFTDVASGATGNGGNLLIETGGLRVADGAQISSGTFGSGDAGALEVNAQAVELAGGSPFGPSGLFAPVAPGATGNGGNLTIAAESLQVAGGAQVFTSTFSSGNAGTMTVKAENVELTGTSPGGESSGLFANVERGARGSGGNLSLTAQRLQLTSGAQIAANTLGTGAAGNLNISARDIDIIGGAPNAPSGLQSTVESEGNGRNLSLSANRLRVTDGAQVAVSTAGSGAAGNLSVRASEVELTGAAEGGASGLFGNAIIGTGDGGDLNIAANQLTIRDGATISASNFSSRNPDVPPGQGRSGNIEIEARSLLLDNGFSNTQGGITAATNSGGGGNITLNSDILTARNGSQVLAETRGSGNGGNINGGGGEITIESDLALLKDSRIVANAVFGPGGNIRIATNGLLALNSTIEADSELGVDGVVEINVLDPLESFFALIIPEFTSSEEAIASSCLNPHRRNAQVSLVYVGRGQPITPDALVDDDHTLTQLEPIDTAQTKRSYQPSDQHAGVARSHQIDNPIVESTDWITTPNGRTQLVAASQLPATPSGCR